MTDTCQAHSGCVTDIKHLKSSDSKQWEEISAMRDKIDGIMTRLNVILGSIVVATIALILTKII